ncbi:MAG TPA: BlaI/MecI/CopY family transcriptional regulator [Longimicrobium sp.]|jgi:predicted transcriptional regulator
MTSSVSGETLPPLGELEAEVMRLVWAHGPASAESLRERLGRPLKESTVRTVLRRLEEKGYVEHGVEGRTYIFRAATPAAEVAERGVRGIADWLYRGSLSDLLVGLVDSSRLAPRELDELAERIARARKEAE